HVAELGGQPVDGAAVLLASIFQQHGREMTRVGRRLHHDAPGDDAGVARQYDAAHLIAAARWLHRARDAGESAAVVRVRDELVSLRGSERTRERAGNGDNGADRSGSGAPLSPQCNPGHARSDAREHRDVQPPVLFNLRAATYCPSCVKSFTPSFTVTIST